MPAESRLGSAKPRMRHGSYTVHIPDWFINFQFEGGDKIWHTVVMLAEQYHIHWHEIIETVELLSNRTAG